MVERSMVRADRERIDDLEHLWRSLQEHHFALAPMLGGLPARSPEESWLLILRTDPSAPVPSKSSSLAQRVLATSAVSRAGCGAGDGMIDHRRFGRLIRVCEEALDEYCACQRDACPDEHRQPDRIGERTTGSGRKRFTGPSR